MEQWDIYDKNGNKINKIVTRGDYLNDNEYHLVVNAWIVNDKNQYLISQRAKNKSHPLMWETTGGSVIKGEDSLTGAIREVKEELSVELKKDDVIFLGKTNRYYKGCPDILEVWLFKQNIDIKNIKIQKEELNDVMWASYDEIIKLYSDGKFEANAFFKEALTLIKN